VNIFDNTHYLVIGAGKQGLAMADYVSEHGGQVTVTDLRSENELSSEISSRSDTTIEWHLGSHSVELLNGVDFVCPSGGVPLSIPLLIEAKKQGIRFTNDSELFTNSVKGLSIGITGTAGKTTTTTLIGRIAEQAVSEKLFSKFYVGGNIGHPLLRDLDQITENDISISEYSSFQLELMNSSPKIAAILNMSPNHIDRHGSMESYTEAKINITKHQSPEDIFIFGRDDINATAISRISPATLFSFGLTPLPEGTFGSYLKNNEIWMKTNFSDQAILKTSTIELMGEHNLLNVMATITICSIASISISAMQKGITGFRGVPHRLEFVRYWKGAKWFNDSKATGPNMILQAINSFDTATILLAGGRDKNLTWDDFAKKMANDDHQFLLFGEAATLINKALQNENKTVNSKIFPSLKGAIDHAEIIAKQNDIVLLSPGGTSFDEFANFEERGNFYKTTVLGFKE
jgi:UDP-N-acetylmuramoylalanine--D-glutamate ligase